MAEIDGGWHAEAEIDIDAPAERVWSIVSDISRHPALAGSGEVLAVRMNGPVAVGTTFESDVRTGEVGSFSPRCVIETLEERRRLGWVSLFPLEEGETEDHRSKCTGPSTSKQRRAAPGWRTPFASAPEARRR